MDAFGEGRQASLSEEDGKWKQPRWNQSLEKPLPPSRCVATTEKGTQCANTSMQGSVRCGAHSTPVDFKAAQARVEQAKLRMIGLVEPAVDVLEELMKPGVADAVRLKAVENVFDRAGLNKGQDLNIQVEQTNQGAAMVSERLAAIRERKEKDEAARIKKEQEDIDVIEVEEEDV